MNQAAAAPQGTALDPDAAQLLAELQACAEAGALRPLDVALARLLHEAEPQVPALVLLAAALTAQMEGQGHSCLPLHEVLEAPEDWLAGPPVGQQRLLSLLRSAPADVAPWLQALRSSPLVAPDDGLPLRPGHRPLVLHADRLYLQRSWRFECVVAAQLAQRSATLLTVDQAAATHWLRQLFPGLAAGGPAAPPASATAFDWQALACALALRGRVTIITGGPGTGKTTTAARLLALAVMVQGGAAPLRLALAAPTGKAAARLHQAIAGALSGLPDALRAQPLLAPLLQQLPPARTLHALLGARPDTRRLRHGPADPLPLDLLVVDEASMVHLEMMAALLQALPPTSRLVLLGDKDQLASVEAGAVLADLCAAAERGGYDAATAAAALAMTGQPMAPEHLDPGAAAEAGNAVDLTAAGTDPAPQALAGDAVWPLARHTVMLRRSHRFDGAIGALAAAVNAGDAATAAGLLRAQPGGALRWIESASPADVVHCALHGRPGAEAGCTDYLRRLRQRPDDPAAQTAWLAALLRDFDRFRLLCAVHDGPWGATALNQAVQDTLARAGALDARSEWYPGRPVMVTRNDAAAGVFNGDIGLVLAPTTPGAALRAAFVAGDGVRSVAVSRLPEVRTAFALTVHKAQGSEFEHTLLVLPPDAGRVLTRELVYTAVTRARGAFTLATARASVLEAALATRTRRASGLRQRLRQGAEPTMQAPAG